MSGRVDHRFFHIAFGLSPVVFVLLGGCFCALPPPPHAWTGPTLPVDQVVARINANNAGIRSIWAHVSFGAHLVDPDSHKVYNIGNGDGYGNLMYRKPFEMRLTGNSILLGRLFEFGSSADEYWASILTSEVSTQWWGRYRNLGKPCSKTIAIRPDLLLEVLGVNDIDTDLTAAPIPVMRFNFEQGCYMFLWSQPMPGHWIAQKDVWYDVQTYLPVRVLLYDANGRVVLRADLSHHQPLGHEAGAPRIATAYDLYFPDTQSRLNLRLSDIAAQRNGLPKEGTIRRRPSPDLKVIQLDEDCGD